MCKCWHFCWTLVVILHVYGSHRLVDIVAKLGETRKEGAGYIVWQEVFDNDVKVVTACLSVSLSVCLPVSLCIALLCLSPSAYLCAFTPWGKKRDAVLLFVYLPDIERLSKFFHCHTQLDICSTIIKDPATPKMFCYTTLWNINVR